MVSVVNEYQGDKERGVAIYFLAHHDDEFFLASEIMRDLAVGFEVKLFYLSHGSLYGIESRIRIAESERSLSALGLPLSHVFHIGALLNVHDGQIAGRFNDLIRYIDELSLGSIKKIVTLAWEGGHIDHDATYLIALYFARKFRPESFRLAFLYNAAGAFGQRFFRVASPIGSGLLASCRKLTGREVYLLLRMLLCYRSQWKTFFAMLPEIVFKYFILRRQAVFNGEINGNIHRFRPHAGKLFYERRFGRSFSELESIVKFLEAESRTLSP